MPKLCLAALLAFSSLGLSAHADYTFRFSDQPFYTSPSGGTAVGVLNAFFTTNDTFSAITSFNLYTSGGGAFNGMHYIPRYASVTASALPSQYFRLDSPDNQYELQLYFVNGLSASGGTLLSTTSYEIEPSGGTRYASGVAPLYATTVPAVTPEPSSFVLLGTGLLGIAGAMKRRFA